MIRQRHLLALLGAAIAALVVCLGAPGADIAVAKHNARTHKPHKLTKRQKAAGRKRMLRSLKRNPQKALGRNFLKKAQAVDLSLPLTLRLRRSGLGDIDDELGIEWSSSSMAWPNGFAPLSPVAPEDPPVGGVVPLDGLSTLEAQFGKDVSGYAGPGVVETVAGGHVIINSGADPLAIPVTDFSVNPGPGDDHEPKCNAPRVELTRVQFDTRERTQSILSLFGGAARLTLHVQLGTTTHVAPYGDCVSSIGASDNVRASTATDPTVPIVLDPTFRISPAITADGRLRLGVLSVAQGDASQPDTFARLTMCVEDALPDGSCHAESFPARLKVLRLNAEVLIGDAMSG